MNRRGRRARKCGRRRCADGVPKISCYLPSKPSSRALGTLSVGGRCHTPSTSAPQADGSLEGARAPGADPGGGRSGGRPPLERRATIQDTPFNSIQAPVHHWAPSPGRNPVSAPGPGVPSPWLRPCVSWFIFSD